MREPDGIDQFFVILAIFILDPDDIVARADAFAQAALFDDLARLVAQLLNRRPLDDAAVADGFVGQTRYGVAAEDERELFAPGRIVHLVPAILRVGEPRTSAGDDVFCIFIYKICSVVDARIGEDQLAVAALRVVDDVEIAVLIGRDGDLHLIAREEDG